MINASIFAMFAFLAVGANAATASVEASVPTSTPSTENCSIQWDCLMFSTFTPRLNESNDIDITVTPEQFLDGRFYISIYPYSVLDSYYLEPSSYDIKVSIIDIHEKPLYSSATRFYGLENIPQFFARAAAQAGSPITIKIHIDVFEGVASMCKDCPMIPDQSGANIYFHVSHIDEPSPFVMAFASIFFLGITRRKLIPHH